MVRVTHDVTSQRKHAQALAEVERRFRATFEHAAGGLALLSLQGEWLQINERLCNIAGYSQVRLLQLRFEELTHPEDREVDQRRTRDMVAGKLDEYTAEKRFVTPDGAAVWVNVTASLVRDSNGNPLYIVAAIEDTSARKLSEEKLRKSERNLRTVLETLPVGVYFTDDSGRIITSNPAAVKIWGSTTQAGMYHSRRIKGRWEDTGKPLQLHEWPLARALSKGESSLGEVIEIETSDQQKRTVYNSAAPIYDERNRIIGAVVVSEDITEWRLAKLALGEAAERLQLANAAAGIGSWAWDLRSDRLTWSDEHYRIFGHAAPCPMPIDKWRQAVHPDERDHVEGLIRAAIRERRLLEVEYRIVRPDGEIRWVSSKGKAFYSPDGTPARILEVVTDITESKRAKEDMQILAALVEYSGDAITGQTPNGIIRTWNRGAEMIFGYSAEEMIGKPITMLTPEGEADDTQRNVERIVRGERVMHHETIRRRKSGERICLSVTISPIRSETGDVIGMSEVARDITAQKHADREIQLLNEDLEGRVGRRTAELEEANRMPESFAYTVSHDLRAPLRTIRGLTQALFEDCGEMLDDTGKDYAFRILDGTARMDALIRDLLEYSRISRSQIRIQPVSMSKAVAEAIEQHLSEAGGGKPDIRVIEPLADVAGHEATVVHVLVNLIGNAIKFVERGNRPVVRIRSEVRGPRVRVWVETTASVWRRSIRPGFLMCSNGCMEYPSILALVLDSPSYARESSAWAAMPA